MRPSYTTTSTRIKYTNNERRAVMEDDPFEGRVSRETVEAVSRTTVVHSMTILSGPCRGTTALKGVQGELGGPATWGPPKVKRTFDFNETFHHSYPHTLGGR